MRTTLILLSFLLSACAGGLTTPGAGRPDLVLQLAPGGLVVAGPGGGEIGFGRAMPGVVEAVRQMTGPPLGEPVTNTECGAGPVTSVRMPGGLMLNFQRGAFQGWVAEQASGPASASGLRPGLPRASLAGAQVQDTSLGTEFEAGGIFGLLDGSGRVDLLWAGVTCFFR